MKRFSICTQTRTLYSLVGTLSVESRVRASCWFARADPGGKDFDLAVEWVLGDPSVKHCSPSFWREVVLAAFETGNWDRLASNLAKNGFADRFSRDERFQPSRFLTRSVWAPNEAPLEQQRQTWREFLLKHHPDSDLSDVQRQFRESLERGDWQTASDLTNDANVGFQGRREVMQCCLERDGLEAALVLADRIEDFKERQSVKIDAISYKLRPLELARLDVARLTHNTLFWPAFGC